MAKLKRAGGVIHTPKEVIADLRAFVARNPASHPSIQKLITSVRDFEGETLLKGNVPREAISRPNMTHAAYMKEAETHWERHKRDSLRLTRELEALDSSYKRASKLAKGFRVVGAVGMVVTVADVADATQRSIAQQSFRPIGAEAIRQGGSWVGAWGGAKVGFMMGAAMGIKTGPGAIATGALGAIVVGLGGYYGADWAADLIDEN